MYLIIFICGPFLPAIESFSSGLLWKTISDLKKKLDFFFPIEDLLGLLAFSDEYHLQLNYKTLGSLIQGCAMKLFSLQRIRFLLNVLRFFLKMSGLTVDKGCFVGH
jgi:hypothetical protein